MAISCDPNALLTAANCIQSCLTEGQMQAIQTKLLCDIASIFTGGGGGGGTGPWVLKAGDTMTGNLLMQNASIGWTPSSGLNVVGQDATFFSGQSTGTGLRGQILFQQSPPGGAGSGVNALSNSWIINASTHFVPGSDNVSDLGSAAQRVRSIVAGTNITLGNQLNWASSTLLLAASNGDLRVANSSASGPVFLNTGLNTSSGGGIAFDIVNGFTLKAGNKGATWNDSSTAGSATVTERYLWGIATPTLTATNTLITYTRASSFFIGGAPVASTNITIGTAYALNVSTGVSNFGGNINMPDVNLVLGTGAGTKIGTATGQKLAFWNKAPIIQPTNAIAAAAFVANTSLIANDSATFGGYTIGQIAAALIATGILT